jgi:hypothetical protein
VPPVAQVQVSPEHWQSPVHVALPTAAPLSEPPQPATVTIPIATSANEPASNET